MADDISILQGVDPNYLQNTLIKDITPLEAIYDLLDNSVDAAREKVVESNLVGLDEYGLPEDYSGYRIRLRVGRNSIILSDNCTGIDEKTLTKQAFVTGFVSSHKYGIGGFGIGLKRALFRLGAKYTLLTDTGHFSASMRFDKSQLSQSESRMSARRRASSGRVRILLHIAELERGVSHEFGARDKVDFVVKSLSRRYGLFLRKGLRISVNGRHVPPFGPKIRKSGPVAAQTSNTTAENGVKIYVDSGMHEAYRLKKESGSARNASLTDQYGWYFVCNDRIVKIASREKELGWKTNWHQEYYGFVGWVRFVAEDPADLPWDTKKTLIDPNSIGFRAISGDLQSFAENYKKSNKKARGKTKSSNGGRLSGSKGTVDDGTAENGSAVPSKATPNPKADAVKGSNSIRKVETGDHNENWTTLLPVMEVGSDHPKLLALMHEASQLPVGAPYAASMLFRAILEFALFEHLKRTRRYSAVREMYFEKQNKDGRGLTPEQKRSFRPTLAHALEWLRKNDDHFPSEVRRECVKAANKFSAHLKELNGVVHESDLTDSGKIKIVRNDTLPLLRYLLRGIDRK